MAFIGNSNSKVIENNNLLSYSGSLNQVVKGQICSPQTQDLIEINLLFVL